MQRVDGGTIAGDQIGEHLTAQGQVGRNFFHLWAPSFDGCRTLLDLDSVLARCVHDWARRAARPVGRNGDQDSQEYLDEFQHPECSQPKPCNRVPRTARRHRSRQLQRITRRLRNPRADEASRIQKLFKTYPKRAVRQVLGEKSPPYSGTAEQAEAYLRDTYVRTRPSGEQCLRAFELYEECEWAPIPEAELELLCQPPHAKEIENKLSRATNTAPGMDGLEYRHLNAVDPKGYLLERIYRAVWRIGIPEAWKKSKTVPIYKKCDTNDYSNFRPISLLPTMYKIFSGILCERNWRPHWAGSHRSKRASCQGSAESRSIQRFWRWLLQRREKVVAAMRQLRCLICVMPSGPFHTRYFESCSNLCLYPRASTVF